AALGLVSHRPGATARARVGDGPSAGHESAGGAEARESAGTPGAGRDGLGEPRAPAFALPHPLRSARILAHSRMGEGLIPEEHRRLIAAALAALDVRNLVLGIHDPSFPSEPFEDTGRGSPYTRGATRFLEFIRELGFTGIQLGPQGQTSESNASP